MNSLVNSNFSRTYNPCGTRNALSDIKRLLTSRDCEGQSKACGYLTEVIQRYNINSKERIRMVEYLLENDMVVFLCEATSNLNFSLFRLILECLRLFWCDRRFFIEEHAAHAMAAVLRSLAHYAATDTFNAVEFCLHFLCDLLSSISSHHTTSALSHQSAYSSEQLLACMNNLATRICGRHRTILCSALVLDALISYQPNELDIRGRIVIVLLEVLNQWFDLLLGGMNHIILVDESEDVGMFLVIMCQLGIDILRLTKVIEKGNQPTDFVQAILRDDQEISVLKQCSRDMKNTIHKVMTDVIVFVKDNYTKINTEEYCVCLKFLLNFLHETAKREVLTNFCDSLVTNGYLAILPQNQVLRNDKIVRRVSTLILGEMLKVLAEKYLIIDDTGSKETCANAIHMGLVELQYGIDKPQNIGIQLQKNQPYSLLIYMYFYCQSSDTSEDCTAALLPHLVEHILRLPKLFKPPGYIIKALWLVFAMSTISNGLLDSLDERVDLERATDRLLAMLHPEPSLYYTHNPAILLWAFTSLRIPYNIRILVLSRWLHTENVLPEDLSKQSLVWELLLNILVQNEDHTTVTNCLKALKLCIEDGDEFTRQDFANLTWLSLPGVLSQALIECEGVIKPNVCYLLDIATSEVPTELDQSVCLKVAVLISALFSKINPASVELESKHRFEHACLKLCLLLFLMPYEEHDNKVLLIFVSRPGFLPSVLTATTSTEDKVACAALQLLTYVVHHFTKNNYQPKSLLQIQSEVILKSLRRDSMNERGVSMLHLLYTILSSGVNSPLVLSNTIEVHPSGIQQCNALKALFLRVQYMLCCKETGTQSSFGWKVLSSILKHAIIYKNDPKLVASLSNQPWTFVLIRFQLTLNVTKEFISFLKHWLTLLKITLAKNREAKNFLISKYSLIKKTLVMINVNVDEDEYGAIKSIAKDILEDCNNLEE